jgi:hypothetical protein
MGQLIYRIMKICSKCSNNKTVDDFPKIGNICKICKNEYNKIYKRGNQKVKDSRKKYYSNNKGKYRNWDSNQRNNPNRIIYRKKYRDQNFDSLKDQSKEYYINNIEYIKKYHSEYYITNRDYINNRNKLYRIENKDKVNLYRRNYNKRRRDKDPLFKLKCVTRTLISSALERKFTIKSKKTVEILGCSYYEFKVLMESKFTSEMNWYNHGKYWEIDHIIPLSWAKSEEEVYKYNHFTNFQPVTVKYNRSKGNLFVG